MEETTIKHTIQKALIPENATIIFLKKMQKMGLQVTARRDPTAKSKNQKRIEARLDEKETHNRKGVRKEHAFPNPNRPKTSEKE